MLIFGISFEVILSKTAPYLTEHLQNTWTKSDETCFTEYRRLLRTTLVWWTKIWYNSSHIVSLCNCMTDIKTWMMKNKLKCNSLVSALTEIELDFKCGLDWIC